MIPRSQGLQERNQRVLVGVGQTGLPLVRRKEVRSEIMSAIDDEVFALADVEQCFHPILRVKLLRSLRVGGIRWQRGEVPWTAPWPFAVGSWMYILDGNGVRPGAPAQVGRVPVAVDARATRRRADRDTLRSELPSTREFLRDLRSRYEAGERATTVLPTTEAVWQANYARSFWRPEHEAFVHGAR
jgi:hypothetical protein